MTSLTTKQKQKGGSRWTSDAETLAALDNLQAKVMSAATLPFVDSTGFKFLDSINANAEGARAQTRAAAIAREEGFEPLGAGASRLTVAVPGDPPAVAKLAYSYGSHGHNVQEAVFWLALPARIRQHIVPSLCLTPRLVLVQARAEVFAYAADGDNPGEDVPRAVTQSLESTEHAEKILACRRGMGFHSEPDEVRVDNFALYGGRVVAIDYAEKWRPIGPVWAWLLHELANGPITLDSPTRARCFDELFAGDGPTLSDNPPTMGRLAELAGGSPDEQPGSPKQRSILDVDARLWFMLAALIDKEPKRPVPPVRPKACRSRQERHRALSEQLAAIAGVPPEGS